VASNVAEGLVARGWEVTLFASGDSLTRAHLHAVLDRGYEEDSNVDPKVAEYLHISGVFELAAEFDLIHSHYDFMPLSYTRLVKTPVLTTIHGARVFVLPNPSGRNANFSYGEMLTAFRALRRAMRGLALSVPPSVRRPAAVSSAARAESARGRSTRGAGRCRQTTPLPPGAEPCRT